MIFDREHRELVARFTRRLATESNRVYIAPGNSATDMVMEIQQIACVEALVLPTIHTLTHAESVSLYYANDHCKELLSPALKSDNPSIVWFLEDYYAKGTKIELIHRSLKKLGIGSAFLVMVARENHNPAYVTTFALNAKLTKELDEYYYKFH